MSVHAFASIEEVDNVLSQLPPETRGADSPFVLRQVESGAYELVAPDEYDEDVASADPARVGSLELLAEADGRRDALLDAGFEFEGHRFQTRSEDRSNIAGAAQMATLAILLGGVDPEDLRWHGGEEDFAWIAEDNSFVPMSAQTTISFGQAAGSRHARIMTMARLIKDRIESGDVETREDLDEAFAAIEA